MDKPKTNELSGFVYKNKIRGIICEGEKKLHIKANAKEALMEYFDFGIKKLANVIVNVMPRKTRGENAGKLKQFTVTNEIIDKARLIISSMDFSITKPIQIENITIIEDNIETEL